MDTAPWYGHGTSEIVIGWAMEELLTPQDGGGEGREDDNDDGDTSSKQPRNDGVISREDIIVNTKIGRYEENPNKQFDFSQKTTIDSVKRSIQRMKCMYIDVLQLHDPEFAPSLQQLMTETIPAMITCRRNGYCKALGITGYPLEVQYQILQRTLDCKFDDDIDGPIWDQALTYGHFNLHDRSLISQPILSIHNDNDDDNQKEKKMAYKSYAEYCYKNSIGVLGAAPLSMGLLTKQGPPLWHPANSTELAKACRDAVTICHDNNVNISTLATVVALSNPQTIPCTIVGMKDISEVITAADCANRYHTVVTTTSTSRSSSEEEEKEYFPGRDIDSWNASSDVLLKQVLSDTEYSVWLKLNDPNDGPFASIWNRKDTMYKWDGIQGVKEFWNQLDNKYRENDGSATTKDVEFWQATSM